LTLIMTVAFSAVMVFLSVLSLPSFIADLGRTEIPEIFNWFTIPIAQFIAKFGLFIVVASFIGVVMAGIFSAIRIWKKRRQRRRPLFG
ncbi:MAG: LapA family protein, partial [Anaerolineales bacterium]